MYKALARNVAAHVLVTMGLKQAIKVTKQVVAQDPTKLNKEVLYLLKEMEYQNAK